jgi:hypothetical protein
MLEREEKVRQEGESLPAGGAQKTIYLKPLLDCVDNGVALACAMPVDFPAATGANG